MGATDAVGKKPLRGDRILIRGEIVSVDQESVVIHIQQNVKAGKAPNIQFSLELKGNLGDNPLPGDFWEIYAKRRRYQLEIERATRIKVPGAVAAQERPR